MFVYICVCVREREVERVSERQNTIVSQTEYVTEDSLHPGCVSLLSEVTDQNTSRTKKDNNIRDKNDNKRHVLLL